jgi:MurNAc alpha-1-phosphate uridylyltransferase
MAAHVEGRDIAISEESPDILDTGGGLKAALPLLGDAPVFTANPDVVWHGPNPFEVAAESWSDTIDALLLCIPAERAVGRETGDFRMSEAGVLQREGPLVYSGLQIIRPGAVRDVPHRKFSLNLVWDDLISRGRAAVAIYPGTWCDVGTPEGLDRAEDIVGRA